MSSNSNKAQSGGTSPPDPKQKKDTTGNGDIIIRGRDSEGKVYASAEEMWEYELTQDKYDQEKGWYGKALNYWENTPATFSGVLGGMDHIHERDIEASRMFIDSLTTVGHSYALDCGAGIGRVTKHLLLPLFDKVDLMEPIEKMIDVAKKELDQARIGHYYITSMEKAELDEGKYDLIVIQWTAIYLTDEDFISFLAKCKCSLKEGGVIFFKENCSSDNNFLVDKDDSSLTRSDAHYKRIFAAAGVVCLKEEVQKNWPSDLLMVKMYALQ
eukprot:Tbor_TRINITY_DN5292_c0_g8::TRINITY_DN5292_c0_g8_i1::g.16445::m.16445/K16219/NTMT1, METTL11A, NTM1; protein N-terminal methyltransferase